MSRLSETLAWAVEATGRGLDRDAVVVEVAERLTGEPWEVVRLAGGLARASEATAAHDGWLSVDLRLRRRRAPEAVRVQRGQPVFLHDAARRKPTGGWDTPPDLARRLVSDTLSAATSPPSVVRDPCCGAGALLVAMDEAGIPSIEGADLDPLLVEVARRACPRAQLRVADALEPGGPVDAIVGNPPFVAPEHQPAALRRRLQARFPDLGGRFDLAVPVMWASTEAVRDGGVAGWWLPASVLVERYGEGLRRRWTRAHRCIGVGEPVRFPGAAVDVVPLVVSVGGGPAMVGPNEVPADEVLAMPGAPWQAAAFPGAAAVWSGTHERSVALGELALVDTGVVAHGGGRTKSERLHDEPGPGRVPFADARGFFEGTYRWLDYEGEALHRPKDPRSFTGPKLVVQRVMGEGPVRARIDRSGLFVGHTCTVVVPHAERSLEVLERVVREPLALALVRLGTGRSRDLYPAQVAAMRVPEAWRAGELHRPYAEALGVPASTARRLCEGFASHARAR